jgi:glutathione reductase (NADPH)
VSGQSTAELTARHVVIATGAQPAHLDIPGEDLLTASEQFLDLEELLTRRIVFAGGGYISFEFASIAAHAGARVSLVHRGARPLTGFDPYLVDQLVAWMRTLGVDIRLDTAVDSIEQQAGHLVVRTRTAQGGTAEISAGLVVHGAGRVPEIGDLALEQAGVAFDRQAGIMVNAYLQSVSNPAVDAAASGAWRLTPLAGLEGVVVAQNLLHGNVQTPNYTGTAMVVYTIPPLARIGLLESEARARLAGTGPQRRDGELVLVTPPRVDGDRIQGARR